MKVPMGPPVSPPPPPLPPPSPPENDAINSSAVAIACNSTTPSWPEPVSTDDSAPPANPISTSDSANDRPDAHAVQKAGGGDRKGLAAPYSIPPWSGHPGHAFSLEVLKHGTIIDHLDVSGKGAYMFGRIDSCDFVLEHPTISRFHAVLQFRKSGEAFIYDLGSTHGTFVNKNQVTKKIYTDLHVGDVIRFGQSSRLYIFQGPIELMPPEGDLNKLRRSKIQEELSDREASLLRARVEASLADGISWGMTEDAPEEESEIVADEITWQTFKGQLTERQEKTRSKIIKRMEKVANMRKEIDAIRAKDIAQGGLTQGQQTQIARNEQRMSQIMEELESLEETLNESIQESVGARVRKVSHSKKKDAMEDEDEYLSEEDDFYDRTKKPTSLTKSNDNQLVETADTLLDKRDAILKEMEDKAALLQKKDSNTAYEPTDISQDDALDAYMMDLSSKIALDATTKIETEVSALQSDLDRVLYLLKIADPTGEAAQKRIAKPHVMKLNESDKLTKIPVQSPPKRKKTGNSVELAAESVSLKSTKTKTSVDEEKDEPTQGEIKKSSYTITKPQWLGDVKEREKVEIHDAGAMSDAPQDEHDKFVGYKERKKCLAPTNNNHEIEDAAPGLILRKQKHVEETRVNKDFGEEPTAISLAVETTAADAVALLLKHKRGYFAGDGELENSIQHRQDNDKPKKKKSKRVLGPEKPAFLENSREYESWVPPEGQSGDGRTSLNEKFGY